MSLAAVILTRNEERHLAACLQSVAFADELIVLDSGSTDATEKISREGGAKFITHPMTEEGFAGQRNFALTQTKADWIFYLDADERLSPEAAAEIQTIVTHNRRDAAHKIKRLNIVFGQVMRHGGHAPDWVTRLFPRGFVKWEGIVHERPVTSLPIKSLQGILRHHTYDDWGRYFDKFNSYTTLMAQRMWEEGKTTSFMGIYAHAIFGFVRFYFIRLGFLDGKQGLIFAVTHGFYTLVKYVKLYYLWRNEK
ncbi:MAG: glycosyltransferase family 2 protein [Selenomonadaceae bacterium]|nr:glycosyltransferase family 2 protein [Selenomonadaceae bacterium]